MEDKRYSLPGFANRVFEIMGRQGKECFLVGGAVRDLVMGRNPKDYDFTTECKPEKVIEIMKKYGFMVIPTGLKHGTITVVIDGENVEITTYRTDKESSDGRHPDEVEFVSDVREDIKRRDFTANGLLYSPETGIVDFFGGISDIENKKIRAIGCAKERLSEDYLRMMRAARFSAQLGFDIDKEIIQAISEIRSQKEKKGEKLLEEISAERKRDELCKILLSKDPVRGLRVLRDTGMLQSIIPPYEKAIGFDQRNEYHDRTIDEHMFATIEYLSKLKEFGELKSEDPLSLMMAALIHDIGKTTNFVEKKDKSGQVVGLQFFGNPPGEKHAETSFKMTPQILKELRFDNKSIARISKLVLYHDFPIYIKCEPLDSTDFGKMPKNEKQQQFFEHMLEGTKSFDDIKRSIPDKQMRNEVIYETNKRYLKQYMKTVGDEGVFRDLLDLIDADTYAQSEYSKQQNSQKKGYIRKLFDVIVEKNEPYKIQDLAVNGQYYREKGYGGVEIGEKLEKMLDEVIRYPARNTVDFADNLEKRLALQKEKREKKRLESLQKRLAEEELLEK